MLIVTFVYVVVAGILVYCDRLAGQELLKNCFSFSALRCFCMAAISAGRNFLQCLLAGELVLKDFHDLPTLLELNRSDDHTGLFSTDQLSQFRQQGLVFNQPASPPLFADCGSWEYCLASAAKSALPARAMAATCLAFASPAAASPLFKMTIWAR